MAEEKEEKPTMDFCISLQPFACYFYSLTFYLI